MLSRDDFLDFAKGILITLVLLGHCIQCLSGDIYYSNTMYYSNWLMKYIYSFHMPMFIYISGYLTFFSIKKRGRVATAE